MPRINIEDSLYRDPKYIKLCIKLGCNYKAMGMLVEAFSLAQKHYLSTDNDRLIPLEEWPTELNVLLEHGFAERKQGGYYVRGSENQFGWLIQRSNAGKAKKSLRKHKEKRPITIDERNTTKPNGSNPLSLSLTLPLSHSLTTNIRSSQNAETAIAQKELNKKIWESYQKAYRQRYKVDPTRNATVNAQISQLAKRLGEESIDIVSFYLLHNDGFYISKCHPVGLCLRDAESLRTQWLRGHALTRSEVKKFEDKEEFVSQQKRFDEAIKQAQKENRDV